MAAHTDKARCAICNGPMTPNELRQAATETIGWTIPRDQGGANHIIGRRTTGKVAHVACAKLGTGPAASPTQGALL